MPVSFLSTTQRGRYGRYPDTLSGEELARYFHLDDDNRDWITTKQRDSTRLGYALQLTTARFLGAFLENPTAVPGTVLHTLSSQLGIATPPACWPTARANSAGSTRPRFAPATATANSPTAACNSALAADCARCAGRAPSARARYSTTPTAGWSATRYCCQASQYLNASSQRYAHA